MKLTDIELDALKRDPITSRVINRLQAESFNCDWRVMAACDSVCLQVLGRIHILQAKDAEDEGHYGSVKYHEERSAELKAHWESIERARDGERQRIRATLGDKGYTQINGKIQI